MWKLFGGRKGLKQLKTGRSTGRFFGCTLGRSVFSLLLAAVLVLSDVLPVPGGLPEQVEAYDRYPSKGTITFYKYTRLTNVNDVAKKNSSYDYFFMDYEYNGSYYAPYTRLLGDDNWPVMKVNEILPHFDAGTSSFYTRTRIWHYKYNRPEEGKFGKDKICIWTQYNGIGAAGDYIKDGIHVTYEHDRIVQKDTATPFNVRPVGSGSDTKFQLVYVYQSDGQDKDWTRLYGDDTKIWGKTNLATSFMFYKVDSFTYTCINSNYTIGENQVYVADRDLFLKEGVKLTIPEGSVLCVKNGPFYVNGEIECYGTILVEDGGIIMPMESTSGGSRIVMKEGGAMIIRSGGRVYAGCPKDSLWTQGDSGWLDMYAGSSIINFGLLVAGKCNFSYGQATIENHKGARMYLGYSVSNEGEHSFMNTRWPGGGAGTGTAGTLVQNPSESSFGLVKTNGTVHYGKGDNITVVKTWDGAATSFANKDGVLHNNFETENAEGHPVRRSGSDEAGSEGYP